MLKRTHYTDEVKTGEVVISGWVKKVRDLGRVKFIILRDCKGIVQITFKRGIVTDSLFEIIEGLGQEDVISVRGNVVKRENTPQGVEVIPSEVDIVDKAIRPLPMDISSKIESNLDVRLDWRVLDLRKPETAAIFKIQAKIVEAIMKFLSEKEFLQVFTPCLMGTASESGAEVFPVVYFEKNAFLRQDPQLHRQLLIAAGFDKIYDLGPNWRAEPSHTPRHLCEYRACAVEFAFMVNESDIMRVEEDLIIAA
ncbi:aspartate--tRNA(Asn) ligase, partial [Candidatus Bathyarchaeota archaeon]|nr:aspartate--tRNA(Asn) ligase [Candidatus Bathyarchaeota archaeon]